MTVQRRWVMFCLAALVLPACGRIWFDPLSASDDAAGGGWLDPAFRYRKPLVIDHTKVAADLTDFPVLIDLADPDLATASPSGADLRFTDVSGNVLAHELERFDLTTVQPQVTAWVKVPAVSAAVDTTIYLYFGNPSAADGQQPTVVWADYAGVYHLGAGTPVDVADASGKNPATNNGVTGVPGRILEAAAFPGGGDRNVRAGSIGVDTSAGGRNTVSFWLNYTGAYNFATFAFYNGLQGYDLWMASSACFGFNTENSDGIGIPASTLVQRWVYVTAVFYNGIADTTNNEIWIDGVKQPLAVCFGTPQPRTAGEIVLGSTGTYSLSGQLDEAHVVAGVRPPGWILTEYRNQSAPRMFVTAGAVELAP